MASLVSSTRWEFHSAWHLVGFLSGIYDFFLSLSFGVQPSISNHALLPKVLREIRGSRYGTLIGSFCSIFPQIRWEAPSAPFASSFTLGIVYSQQRDLRWYCHFIFPFFLLPRRMRKRIWCEVSFLLLQSFASNAKMYTHRQLLLSTSTRGLMRIFVSGFHCRKIGFYGVFTMAGLLYSVALFYGIFVLKEVPPKKSTSIAEAAAATVEKSEAVKRSLLADFFDFAHVRETFRVAFRSGQKNRRSRIILLMAVVVIVIGPQHGTFRLAIALQKNKFSFEPQTFRQPEQVKCPYFICSHDINSIGARSSSASSQRTTWQYIWLVSILNVFFTSLRSASWTYTFLQQAQLFRLAYSLVCWNLTTHWSEECPAYRKFSRVLCMRFRWSNGTCIWDQLLKSLAALRTLQCVRWPRKLLPKKNWEKSIRCSALWNRSRRSPTRQFWPQSIRTRWHQCLAHSSWLAASWPFPVFVYSCKFQSAWPFATHFLTLRDLFSWIYKINRAERVKVEESIQIKKMPEKKAPQPASTVTCDKPVASDRNVFVISNGKEWIDPKDIKL